MIPMKGYGVVIIGCFIIGDLAWAIINCVQYIIDQDKVNPHFKMRFTSCYGISKLLMLAAPVPFFLYNVKCLKDNYVNRRLLYRTIICNVVPTQLMTMIVLIFAISLDWIVAARFWISMAL